MGWKRGESGNPGGRSREKPFRDALRLELAAAGADHKKLRRIAKVLIDKAEAGDLAAMSMVFDRIDGRVPQEIGGSDELGPTQLHISWKSNDRPDMEPVASAPLLIEHHNSPSFEGVTATDETAAMVPLEVDAF